VAREALQGRGTVFFEISKLAWFVLAPSHFIVWTSVAAAGLLLAGRMHEGRIAAVVSAAMLLFLGVFPLGTWLVRPLEDRYPRPPWPKHVDGMLILGGGLDPVVLASRGVPAEEHSEPRLVAGVELARRYPNARIIFSGGSALLGSNHRSESEVARYVFGQLGLNGARLSLEARSRDTWENIALSRKIARPRPGQVWILVTSAVHMPRAMESATAQGWKMVPWPSDYLTTPDGLTGFLHISENLSLVDAGVHEWFGSLAYRLRSWRAATAHKSSRGTLCARATSGEYS
jgi:uncharacterized SAM-binding protein YcdF (DUF218 family)